jgi:hypothetical protein
MSIKFDEDNIDCKVNVQTLIFNLISKSLLDVILSELLFASVPPQLFFGVHAILFV